MPINKSFACILALGALLCGCSQEEDILPNQQQRMVSYLQSTHSPKLVPLASLVGGEQLPYYTTSGNTVYRYISNVYDPERADRPEVNRSSTVTITFRAYRFGFSNIVTSGTTVTMPYYTNDPTLYDAFASLEGFDPEYWNFGPLRIDLRSDNILKGLRLALLGCREGDEVEAYMTYNMAYGDDNFGIIPRETPIAVFFTVNTVE